MQTNATSTTVEEMIDSIQIEKGTEATEYEPYTGGQPSPNPDYPQEIKSVSGVENLLPNNIVSQELNGITFTVNNDKTITATGTATGVTDIYFVGSSSEYIDMNLEDGTYNLNGCQNGSMATYMLYCVQNRAGTLSYYQSFQDKGVDIETQSGDTFRFFIRVLSGATLDNITFKPMLSKTKVDYVPYGHWLKVKNTGKNLFTLGEEVYPISNVSMSLNDSKIKMNGTVSAAGNLLKRRDDFPIAGRRLIGVFKPGNYIYSCSIKNGSITLPEKKEIELVLKKQDDTFIKSVKYSSDKLTTTYSFTLTETTKLYSQLYANGVGTIFDNVIMNFQIEKGTVATEYEPYQEQSMLIDMNKPNLLDMPYTLENKLTDTSTRPDYYVRTAYYATLEAGKKYKFSCETDGNWGHSTSEDTVEVYLMLNNEFTTVINMSTNQYVFTPTVSGNYYVRYDINMSGKTHSFWNFKITEGQEYYELSSIGDTKDELNIDKYGNVSITQNIGEAVITSVMGTRTNGSGETLYQATVVELKDMKVGNWSKGYCDKYKVGNWVKENNVIRFGANDKHIFLYTDDENFATTESANAYLSNNPVTVKYILAEPQTISLGKYNKIESIDDTENITIQTNIDTTFTKISYNLVNWYNLGNFLITKPTDDDVKDTLTFDSMDYTKKFNKSFDASGISFPCTALQLAKYCCKECGVELATNEFINYDFEVIDNQYTNEDTFRNVMQDIGKLAYSWVRIGWDNKCYIDFNYGKEVDEYNKIDNDNYYDLELQQKTFGPVNRVIIGMSDVEGENVYIEDEESIAEYGVTELQIYDNNLTYTPELRNKVINSAKVLFGLTYTPMTLNTTGHPWFLGNEKVEVTGMDNTIYYMYPWDRTITYSGHIKSKLDSKGETKTETEYKYKGDVESVLKKTRIIVNKQEGTITSLTQTTTTIQDNLQQNYYDKTQTNRLIQTSGEGITNTFSEAGGNNIFRNTGLWFEDSSTSYYIYPKSDLYPSNQTFTNGQRAYEFWDGLILKEYYDKAANLTAMSLQNGYFEQKQQVPNGNYTVSFKYKKLIESATTKVIINNVEYNLTKLEDTEFRTGEQDSDGNYITQPLEVTDGYIFVRFYTNVNNSTIIYDLMVNAGSVKLAYSQNQNETTTDTVNISKGITITSSNTDTTFKANSDGIRTLNKNNETLSEFTDKGMKNKQIEVTDEATIVQVLWQNVGDQTWLTRL